MTETLAPSRRSFVRAAAWTVPVVSVAATAPAFALTPVSSSFLSAAVPLKWSDASTKHVSWDLTLTNTGAAIESLSVNFTYAPKAPGVFTAFTIYDYQPVVLSSWNPVTVPPGGASTVTATHNGVIAKNSTTRIHSDFAGDDNSSGKVSAVATIKYVGIVTPVQRTIDPVAWDSGSAHAH